MKHIFICFDLDTGYVFHHSSPRLYVLVVVYTILGLNGYNNYISLVSLDHKSCENCTFSYSSIKPYLYVTYYQEASSSHYTLFEVQQGAKSNT